MHKVGRMESLNQDITLFLPECGGNRLI